MPHLTEGAATPGSDSEASHWADEAPPLGAAAIVAAAPARFQELGHDVLCGMACKLPASDLAAMGVACRALRDVVHEDRVPPLVCLMPGTHPPSHAAICSQAR